MHKNHALVFEHYIKNYRKFSLNGYIAIIILNCTYQLIQKLKSEQKSALPHSKRASVIKGMDSWTWNRKKGPKVRRDDDKTLSNSRSIKKYINK
jgi:hypothetical protein